MVSKIAIRISLGWEWACLSEYRLANALGIAGRYKKDHPIRDGELIFSQNMYLQ
jgi:hypothetical protein